MKFNFRKIASALASTAIVGSTVALAAAASFPAPFVQNGAADVAIVYGNTLDLAAVTDVSTSLNSALGGGSTPIVVSDEAYALFTSSTPLQLNNSVNSVKTSITETNLPSVLSDTSFSGDVDANVEFRITLGSNPRLVFDKIPTSSVDPIVGVSYATTSGSYLYNATATFSKSVAFNHSDSEGSDITLFGQKFLIGSATDGTNLVLFKSAERVSLSVGGATPNPTATVTIDGETYTVELASASDTSATIKVTDSSGNFDQKEINEAASKKIRGLDVAVDLADESTATDSISATIIMGSEKYTLTDGSEVKKGSDDTTIQGTKVDFNNGGTATLGNQTSLTVQVFAADGSNDAIRSGDELIDPIFGTFRVALKGLSIETDDTENRETFIVDKSGSDKMTLKFSTWEDKEKTIDWLNNESGAWAAAYLADANDYRIFVKERDKINESAYAVVGNEDTGYLVKLQSITNTSGTATQTSAYSSDAVKFENVFDNSQTWSTSITGEGTGEVVIGGKTYGVTYQDNQGGNADEFVRLNYPDSSGNDMIAFPTIQTSKGAKLMFYEPLLINVTNWDGSNNNVSNIKIPDGDGYSNIVVATNIDMWHGSNNFTVTVGAGTAGELETNGTDSVDGLIGRLRWNVTAGAQAKTDSPWLPLDGGEANATNYIGLYLEDLDGTIIENPAIVLFEEKDESNTYEAVIIKTSGAGTSSSGTGVNDVDFTWDGDTDFGSGSSSWGASGLQRESNDKLYDMMDQFGTLVTTDQSDSDQYIATISYPDNQVTAELYLDSLASTGGSSTLGDISVMDSELASSGMATKNLVVVGGSCVNSLASQLLGGAVCGPSWTTATGAGSGEFIIQTFANPNAAAKVATVVAGYEQGDTKNAATYLTTQTVDTTVGKKYVGSTATIAQLVTA